MTNANQWTSQNNRNGWYVVGILLIAWVLAYLDRGIINLLAQDIKTEMNLTDTQLSLLQGFAFSAAFAVAGLPIGYLIDKYNRRNIIIVGTTVWSAATFACGMANSYETLFAARMFVGIGEACLAPAAFSIIADLFPPDRRGRAMGVMMGGSSIGNAVSIFVGGLLLILLGTAAYNLPLLGTLSPTQMTFVLVSLPGLFVILLLFTFREPPRLSNTSLELAPAAGPSMTAYLWKYRGAFSLVYGLLMCNVVVANTAAIWGPAVLMRLYGMTAGNVGIWLGLLTLLVGPAFGYLGGFMADRFSKKYPLNGRLRVALISCPVSILILAGYLVESPAAIMFVFAGLSAFGNMLVGASYSALHDLVPASLRGRVVALLLFITSLVGIGLGGTLVALVTDLVFQDDSRVQDSLLIVLVPFAVLGLLLAIWALGPYARVRQALLQSEAKSPAI